MRSIQAKTRPCVEEGFRRAQANLSACTAGAKRCAGHAALPRHHPLPPSPTLYSPPVPSTHPPASPNFPPPRDPAAQPPPHLRVGHVPAEQRPHQHRRHAQVGRLLQHLCRVAGTRGRGWSGLVCGRGGGGGNCGDWARSGPRPSRSPHRIPAPRRLPIWMLLPTRAVHDVQLHRPPRIRVLDARLGCVEGGRERLVCVAGGVKGGYGVGVGA
jgi:hypothetical protein